MKKILCVLISIIVIANLYACNGGSNSSESSNQVKANIKNISKVKDIVEGYDGNEDYYKYENRPSVVFGKYNGEDIEWFILNKDGKNYTLISKYILDYVPYGQHFNENGHGVWDNSDIQKFCYEFSCNSFTDEQQVIMQTRWNTEYYNDGSWSSFGDYVSVLTYDEYDKVINDAITLRNVDNNKSVSHYNNSYLDIQQAFKAKPTRYAKNKGIRTFDESHRIDSDKDFHAGTDGIGYAYYICQETKLHISRENGEPIDYRIACIDPAGYYVNDSVNYVVGFDANGNPKKELLVEFRPVITIEVK